MSYTKHVVRPNDRGKDISLLCFRACFNSVLVHPKGGRLVGSRIVISYMGYGNDHAPWSSRGRR